MVDLHLNQSSVLIEGLINLGDLVVKTRAGQPTSGGAIFAGGGCVLQHVHMQRPAPCVCRTTRLLLMGENKKNLSDLHPNPTTDEGETGCVSVPWTITPQSTANTV